MVIISRNHSNAVFAKNVSNKLCKGGFARPAVPCQTYGYWSCAHFINGVTSHAYNVHTDDNRSQRCLHKSEGQIINTHYI